MAPRQPTTRSATQAALAAVGSVVLVTAAIYGVRELAPVASTGVLYLLAVLFVSARWGFVWGVVTAVLGALAFNFFHLPPTGRLAIASDENWVALAVFLVAAVVSGRLADSARNRALEAERRTREADALASFAEVLLAAESSEQARAALAARISAAFDLPSATVELRTAPGDERTLDLPLATDGQRVGTLLVPRDTPPAVLDGLHRVAPSLAAMLAVSASRERLASEVVETQALRRSDVVKTALLRAVSHDLRSPLTAIVAAADGLEAGHGQGDGELVEVIGEESRRLARMVDDLLDLTRLEAGSATPHPRWCALDEVVEAAVAELPPDARVMVDFEADLPLVEADPAQLERVVANLLVNASVHGGPAPIAVRVRHVSHRVRVRVSDQGPGIPREALERVFEPFRQEDASQQGAGLGLAIARGFAEANGGRLWAESLPGQGATFTLELPVRVRPRASAPAGEGQA